MESEHGLVKRQGVWETARLWGRFALDQLFPPVCLVCSDAVETPDGLCAGCWRQLVPITPPVCPVLGLPFSVSMGPEAVSAQALADPPPFERARSAVLYGAVARRIVSLLKYSDRPELALFCGRLMAVAGHELLGADAVLAPVPLHPVRQWSRRYNQSTELARAVAGLAGTRFDTDLVRRGRNTARQVGLSARQRARNVAGAFRPVPDLLARLGGRRVVLVDDVITTGATVRALARCLKTAGVERVDVLSFARVGPGEAVPT